MVGAETKQARETNGVRESKRPPGGGTGHRGRIMAMSYRADALREVKDPKTVYNKATGEFQKPATKMDTTKWWLNKLRGKGTIAQQRNEMLNERVDRATEGESN